MLQILIQRPNNKQTINDIVEHIGDSPEMFQELMNVFLTGTSREAQTTSWAIGHIGEQHPELITPYHSVFIEKLLNKHNHDAIRRNIVRIYQTCEISDDLEGKLYSSCMGLLLDPKEAIAVRAFSMWVCRKIALKYFELIPELIDSIHSILPGASSGLSNRGQKTVKELERIISTGQQ